MSYTATYGGHERVPGERQLRRDHPLGLRKTYDDPADSDDRAGARRWSFGVAAGALLVAGTFAAGALGLNDGAAPLATGSAPEHAPAAPGNSSNGSNGDIGGPAVAPPPSKDADRAPAKVRPAAQPPVTAAPAPAGDHRSQPAAGGSGASGSADAAVPAPAPAPVPAPAPAPAPTQPPAQESRPGLVDGVVDTVGGVVDGVTDTVGGVLSPVTGILGVNDQPAMTMINPGGDLFGS